MCLYVLSFVLWCLYDFWIKTIFITSLPPVVCRRAQILFMLFVVCLHIVVSNTYHVVFLFCFSSSCCQVFWIVHFWLPLWYYLTFINYLTDNINVYRTVQYNFEALQSKHIIVSGWYNTTQKHGVIMSVAKCKVWNTKMTTDVILFSGLVLYTVEHVQSNVWVFRHPVTSD